MIEIIKCRITSFFVLNDCLTHSLYFIYFWLHSLRSFFFLISYRLCNSILCREKFFKLVLDYYDFFNWQISRFIFSIYYCQWHIKLGIAAKFENNFYWVIFIYKTKNLKEVSHRLTSSFMHLKHFLFHLNWSRQTQSHTTFGPEPSCQVAEKFTS